MSDSVVIKRDLLDKEQTQRALYVCYFGLREPLVQTQVLPYIREVKKLRNVEMEILTFEPELKTSWTEEEISETLENLADEGITWHFLPYHKTPSVPMTIYDVLNGARLIRRLISERNIDLLHARVHIPALMAVLARKFSSGNPKVLFDIRGFFPEEYTDAGRWKENGWLYRAVKRVERWLLKESDGFVVLTHKAKEILFPEAKEERVDGLGRPVEVIPCCVDLNRFDIDLGSMRKQFREKIGAREDQLVVVYVGSFGGFYLTEETIDFYRIAKQKNKDAFALILTQSDPDMVTSSLKQAGYGEEDYFIQKVPPGEIPGYLSAADFSLSFIKPSYSKLASSPTKNAEYLACGLPIVLNDKIGDSTSTIRGNNVGVIIDSFGDDELTAAFDEVMTLKSDATLVEKCKEVAVDTYDLVTVGGKRYQRIYRNLLRTDQ